jgi:hypothetical protein
MSKYSTPVPVASPRVLFLLYSILLAATVDLSLSAVNVGLTSFFLGLISSGATIIHVLTNLFIILYHLRRRTHSRPNTQFGPWQSSWELFPPTSKLSSITMDAILGIMFIAAFITSLLVHITNYFGGGNVEGSEDGKGSNLVKGPVAVLYADAAMELLCGILLLTLSVVGSFERRWIQEVTKNFPLGDGSINKD